MLQHFIHKTISTRLWFTVASKQKKMAGLSPGFSHSCRQCKNCKISKTCMPVMDPENISCINYAESKDQRKIRDWLKMGNLQNKKANVVKNLFSMCIRPNGFDSQLFLSSQWKCDKDLHQKRKKYRLCKWGHQHDPSSTYTVVSMFSKGIF